MKNKIIIKKNKKVIKFFKLKKLFLNLVYINIL